MSKREFDVSDYDEAFAVKVNMMTLVVVVVNMVMTMNLIGSLKLVPLFLHRW